MIIEVDEQVDDGDLETDKTLILEHAHDLDKKEDADELEAMLGMKSTVQFDTSILTQVTDLNEKPTKEIMDILSDKDIIVEPLTSVPLCPPAAKFLSESQKKVLIPDLLDLLDSDDEDFIVTEKILTK